VFAGDVFNGGQHDGLADASRPGEDGQQTRRTCPFSIASPNWSSTSERAIRRGGNDPALGLNGLRTIRLDPFRPFRLFRYLLTSRSREG
jgi:hypothetical protein